MYQLNGNNLDSIEQVTFLEIDIQEKDIEEMLRCNIEMICGEEESMIIVGKQVRNEQNGRSDLTAIDNDGNIVLVEIKRDKKDIIHRKEAFEFQAIRYAASYATIDSIEELVKLVYEPYIKKHRNEYQFDELTCYEYGIRKINDFLIENGADDNFNENQRIILAAADYDAQTLSAVAWLNKNSVDISCYKLKPYIIKDDVFIDAKKILPITDYSDYYVNLIDKKSNIKEKRSGIERRNLPRIADMLKWGVVKPGDILTPKNREDEAVLLKNGKVDVDGKEMSIQKWLKQVYGWSSVETYRFSIHKKSGKRLSDIRREYMEKELLNEEGENIE